MRLSTLILYIAILLISVNFAFGATVHGDVFDYSLNKISGVQITVNTTPEQLKISKDGSYEFEIPEGFYVIEAEARIEGDISKETREVTITGDGNYVLDLLLLPTFEEEDEFLEIDDFSEILEEEETPTNYASFLVVLFILILIVILYFIFKKRKSKENVDKEKIEDVREVSIDDSNQILDIIKKEGGRTTQKEIRKHIPLSEAKISLMIAELEHKGLIQKIKKGRGNIIILK